MKKECKKSCKQEIFVVVLLIMAIGFISYNMTESNVTGNVIGEACSVDGDCGAVEFCLNDVCAGTCAYYTNETSCLADALSLAEDSNNYFLLGESNYSELPSGGFCGTEISLVYDGEVMTVTNCGCSWNASVCGDSPVLESVQEETSSECSVDWGLHNESCSLSEEYVVYYLDSNNCNVTTDMPSNETGYCDYDGDGLIGNKDDVILTRYDKEHFEFKFGGSDFNSSSNYSGTKKVEFVENERVILEFNWNFNNAFNFNNIEVRRQTGSANEGYIIINGLDVSKTAYVDRISNSDKVCIKDEEIDSINEISSSCNGTDEVLLDCPESNIGFDCRIINDTYKITGLKHSAVLEFGEGVVSNCTPSWNCNNWSDCVSGSQSRNCSDLNNCGSNVGIPSETRVCGEGSCISSWSCTEWEDCKDDKEVRACADINGCPVETDMPPEQRECGSASINWPVTFGVIATLLVLGIIVAIILHLLNKGEDDGQDKGVQGQGDGGFKPPVLPGSVSAPRRISPRQPRPPVTRPMPKEIIRSAPRTRVVVKPIPKNIPKVTPPPK